MRRSRVLGRHTMMVILVLWAISVLPFGPAKADGYYPYISVVCQGNDALIRFTYADNDRRPVFQGVAADLPNAAIRRLDNLEPANPSTCRLRDRRQVTLWQWEKDDSRSYGPCREQSTQLFSLWIGRKPVYQRHVWDGCGDPFKIRAISLTGGRLIECRDLSHLRDDEPVQTTCIDRIDRMRVPDATPGRRGRMRLIHAAHGMEQFCHGLPRRMKAEEFSFDGPWRHWPTFRWRKYEVVLTGDQAASVRIRAGATAMGPAQDGKPRWTRLETSTPREERALWAIFPDSMSARRDAILKQVELLDKDAVDALRASGVVVYAGDQTGFRQVQLVFLTPFVRNGSIWMHASSEWWLHDWRRRSDELTDYVLRPTPQGNLEEVCFFKRSYPL